MMICSRPSSEKQLKHILQKWDIKKKVKDHDMQSMLSLKRKRDMQGKASQFVYHGALVSNEKLQRAAKRAKVLPASPGTVTISSDFFCCTNFKKE